MINKKFLIFNINYVYYFYFLLHFLNILNFIMQYFYFYVALFYNIKKIFLNFLLKNWDKKPKIQVYSGLGLEKKMAAGRVRV